LLIIIVFTNFYNFGTLLGLIPDVDGISVDSRFLCVFAFSESLSESDELLSSACSIVWLLFSSCEKFIVESLLNGRNCTKMDRREERKEKDGRKEGKGWEKGRKRMGERKEKGWRKGWKYGLNESVNGR